ncbi:MAG: hypothetical protein AB1403_08670 [Candidatus Riflebacteria bacterium]
MNVSKRCLLGLMLLMSILVFSSLGFSEDKLSPEKAFRYFASLYVPYETARTAGFSMTFGNELAGPMKSAVKTAQELPARTFLK